MKKLFGKKNKTALLTVLGLVGIFLIFLSELNFPNKENKKETSFSESGYSYEYCDYLENKVKEIVESINGAGKTSVMITLSETTEYVYAVNEKEVNKNTDKNSDTNNQNDYVIIDKDNNDAGLLLKTIEPKVRGVAVVCEGGDDVKVQEQIYSAVGAVLNVSSSRISISKLSLGTANGGK